MNKFIERIQKGPRPDPLTQIKLEVARFRNLLENARAIMTLVADGHEKLKEEYIFDRHYVVSLVDQAIERSGMLVFDAVVLAPEGGEALYRFHDQLKTFAIDQFIKECSGSNRKSLFPDPGNIPEEPEFRLLFQVVSWTMGPLLNGFPTLTDFIRRIFDHVIPALRSGTYVQSAKCRVEFNGADSSHRIDVIELEPGPMKEGRVFINDLDCRPLGLMLIGAGRKLSDASALSPQAAKKWVALIGKDQLSLRGLGPENKLYLEAALSGHTDSDFLFIFAENPLDLEQIVPPEFHMEKTGLGALAWCFDVSGVILESRLTQMGESLL